VRDLFVKSIKTGMFDTGHGLRKYIAELGVYDLRLSENDPPDPGVIEPETYHLVLAEGIEKWVPDFSGTPEDPNVFELYRTAPSSNSPTKVSNRDTVAGAITYYLAYRLAN